MKIQGLGMSMRNGLVFENTGNLILRSVSGNNVEQSLQHFNITSVRVASLLAIAD
jgi:hypothetical protein